MADRDVNNQIISFRLIAGFFLTIVLSLPVFASPAYSQRNIYDYHYYPPPIVQEICITIPILDFYGYLPSPKEPIVIAAFSRQAALSLISDIQYRQIILNFYNQYLAPPRKYYYQNIVDKYKDPLNRHYPDNFFRKFDLDKQRKDEQNKFDALQHFLLQLSRLPPIKIIPPLK